MSNARDTNGAQWPKLIRKMGVTADHDKWIQHVLSLAGKRGPAKQFAEKRIHYDAARPQIVAILEAGHAALTALNMGNYFKLDECKSELRDMGNAYRELVQVVISQRSRYKEPDLVVRLKRIAESVNVELPLPASPPQSSISSSSAAPLLLSTSSISAAPTPGRPRPRMRPKTSSSISTTISVPVKSTIPSVRSRSPSIEILSSPPPSVATERSTKRPVATLEPILKRERSPSFELIDSPPNPSAFTLKKAKERDVNPSAGAIVKSEPSEPAPNELPSADPQAAGTTLAAEGDTVPEGVQESVGDTTTVSVATEQDSIPTTGNESISTALRAPHISLKSSKTSSSSSGNFNNTSLLIRLTEGTSRTVPVTPRRSIGARPDPRVAPISSSGSGRDTPTSVTEQADHPLDDIEAQSAEGEFLKVEKSNDTEEEGPKHVTDNPVGIDPTLRVRNLVDAPNSTINDVESRSISREDTLNPGSLCEGAKKSKSRSGSVSADGVIKIQASEGSPSAGEKDIVMNEVADMIHESTIGSSANDNSDTVSILKDVEPMVHPLPTILPSEKTESVSVPNQASAERTNPSSIMTFLQPPTGGQPSSDTDQHSSVLLDSDVDFATHFPSSQAPALQELLDIDMSTPATPIPTAPELIQQGSKDDPSSVMVDTVASDAPTVLPTVVIPRLESNTSQQLPLSQSTPTNLSAALHTPSTSQPFVIGDPKSTIIPRPPSGLGGSSSTAKTLLTSLAQLQPRSVSSETATLRISSMSPVPGGQQPQEHIAPRTSSLPPIPTSIALHHAVVPSSKARPQLQVPVSLVAAQASNSALIHRTPEQPQVLSPIQSTALYDAALPNPMTSSVLSHGLQSPSILSTPDAQRHWMQQQQQQQQQQQAKPLYATQNAPVRINSPPGNHEIPQAKSNTQTATTATVNSAGFPKRTQRIQPGSLSTGAVKPIVSTQPSVGILSSAPSPVQPNQLSTSAPAVTPKIGPPKPKKRKPSQQSQLLDLMSIDMAEFQERSAKQQQSTSNFTAGDDTTSDGILGTPAELAGSLLASLSRKRIHEEDESDSTLSAKRTRNDSVVVASASQDNQLGSATTRLAENDNESCAVKGSQTIQAMRTLPPPLASAALSIPPPPVPPSTVVRSHMSNDSSENLHFPSATITFDHLPSLAPSSIPVIPPPPALPSMPSSEMIISGSKKALPLHRRREEIVQIVRGLPQSGSLSFTVSIADEEYARLQKWTRRWEAPGETDEAMCVSIEMYAHDDCWSLDAEDSPRLSWPTGRTVYVRIAGADKTNVENIYLNSPTLKNEDGRVDLTSYLHAGINEISIHQIGWLADFVFVIRVHVPTVKQLAAVECRKQLDEGLTTLVSAARLPPSVHPVRKTFDDIRSAFPQLFSIAALPTPEAV